MSSVEYEFPYVHTWSREDPEKLFANLLAYEPTTIPLDINNLKDKIPKAYKKAFEGGRAFLTKDFDLSEYRNINAITDFFTEKIRLLTSRRKFMPMTPMEIWTREYPAIISLAKQKYGSDDPYHVRLAIFEYTKESNNFRPTIALAIYQLFLPGSILDISAGWGDRLIAAIAYSSIIPVKDFQRYIAFDPNVNLQPAYRQIIEKFTGSIKSKQFRVIPEAFENSEPILRELGYTYDLVFSSIPYFDLELYDLGPYASPGRTKQSTTRYPSINTWITSFLIPAIRISAKFLRKNGYLAINMEGQFVTVLFQRFSLLSFEGLQYEGITGYQSDVPKDKKLHPIYVWRRT